MRGNGEKSQEMCEAEGCLADGGRVKGLARGMTNSPFAFKLSMSMSVSMSVYRLFSKHM